MCVDTLSAVQTQVLISDALTAFLTLRATNYFSEDVIKKESFYLLVRNQMNYTCCSLITATFSLWHKPLSYF